MILKQNPATTSRRGSSERIVYGFVIGIISDAEYVSVKFQSSVVDVPETKDFSVAKCHRTVCGQNAWTLSEDLKYYIQDLVWERKKG